MYTKLQIIEQLFDNGYCKDPTTRAVDSEGCCQYQTEDGKQCAVGKCLVNPEQELGSVSFIENLEFKLKPKHRGHEVEFWIDLQVLHDSTMGDRVYWDESGMTELGKQELQRLKTKWALLSDTALYS